MEQGESVEQCLTREIKEEFSINIAVNEFFTESIHEYEDAKIRLLAYRITWVSGKMVPKDHDRLAWVLPDTPLTYLRKIREKFHRNCYVKILNTVSVLFIERIGDALP